METTASLLILSYQTQTNNRQAMLTITVNNQQVSAILAQIADRMSDLTPAMQHIGTTIETRALQRFETETDPNGQPWAPWAENTRKYYPFPGSKAAAGDDGPGNARILDRYGALLGSSSHNASADSVRIGFGAPYASFHEWGTNRMPRRGILMDDPDAGTLSHDDEATVLEILNDYFHTL